MNGLRSKFYLPLLTPNCISSVGLANSNTQPLNPDFEFRPSTRQKRPVVFQMERSELSYICLQGSSLVGCGAVDRLGEVVKIGSWS